jgi:hypothetical protein
VWPFCLHVGQVPWTRRPVDPSTAAHHVTTHSGRAASGKAGNAPCCGCQLRAPRPSSPDTPRAFACTVPSHRDCAAMADGRGVPSSGRRTTPAPQPPSKAATATATTRRRGTRSASRHVDAPSEPARSTRRSARHASVDSALGEYKHNARALSLSRAKLKAQKEAVAGESRASTARRPCASTCSLSND